MALRKIIKLGNETLLMKSRNVDKFDAKLHQLLDDLCDTMHQADGAGLAAVQVSVLKRVAVVEIEDTYLELVNPVIVDESGQQTSYEGCLSVNSDRNCEVTRPQKLTVEYQDRFGEEKVFNADGFLAKAISHEVDHLDGILFISKKVKKSTEIK